MYFNGTTSVSRYSNKCMQHKLNEKLNTFLENKKGKHNINVGFTIYLVHYNFTYCTVCYSHGHLAVLLRDHNIICKIYILKRWKKRDSVRQTCQWNSLFNSNRVKYNENILVNTRPCMSQVRNQLFSQLTSTSINKICSLVRPIIYYFRINRLIKEHWKT